MWNTHLPTLKKKKNPMNMNVKGNNMRNAAEMHETWENAARAELSNTIQ